MSSHIHPIKMPKFGLSMREGKVAGWLVAPGQIVTRGQDLVEIETEKITNIYESPVAGILRRQLVEPGHLVPVGHLIGIVTEGDVGENELENFIAEFSSTKIDEENNDAIAITAHLLELNGVPIRYLEGGTGENVLLLHGFSGDGESWMFNQSVLAETCHVIALDLPGHGGSGKVITDGSVNGLAQLILQFMHAKNMDCAHIVGHSLGGAVAIELTAIAAERVKSLSLIAPAGVGGQVNGDFIAGILEAERTRAMKTALSYLFADPAQVTTNMANNALRAKRMDGAQAALATIAGANFTSPDSLAPVRDAFNALSLPIQIIWGEEDRVIALQKRDDLPQNIPLYSITSAGHMPQMEAAAEVNHILLTFFSSFKAGE